MLRKRLQPCQSTIIVTLTCVFAGKFRGGQFLGLLVTTSGGSVVMRARVVWTHSLSARRSCLPPHKDSGAHWEGGPLPPTSSLCRGESKRAATLRIGLVAKKECLSSPNVLETFLAGWSVRLLLTVWLGDCVVEALFVFPMCVCVFLKINQTVHFFFDWCLLISDFLLAAAVLRRTRILTAVCLGEHP